MVAEKHLGSAAPPRLGEVAPPPGIDCCAGPVVNGSGTFHTKPLQALGRAGTGVLVIRVVLR